MGFIIAGFSRRLNELENAQAEFEAQHAAMLDARRNFWDAMSGQTHTTTNPTITVSDDQNT